MIIEKVGLIFLVGAPKGIEALHFEFVNEVDCFLASPRLNKLFDQALDDVGAPLYFQLSNINLLRIKQVAQAFLIQSLDIVRVVEGVKLQRSYHFFYIFGLIGKLTHYVSFTELFQ